MLIERALENNLHGRTLDNALVAFPQKSQRDLLPLRTIWRRHATTSSQEAQTMLPRALRQIQGQLKRVLLARRQLLHVGRVQQAAVQLDLHLDRVVACVLHLPYQARVWAA